MSMKIHFKKIVFDKFYAMNYDNYKLILINSIYFNKECS
jgi:hypothetical protein